MSAPIEQKFVTRVFEVSRQAVEEHGFLGLRKLMRKAASLQPGETLKIGSREYTREDVTRLLSVREGKKAGRINSYLSAFRAWLHQRFGNLPTVGRYFKLPESEATIQKRTRDLDEATDALHDAGGLFGKNGVADPHEGIDGRFGGLGDDAERAAADTADGASHATGSSWPQLEGLDNIGGVPGFHEP